MRPVILLLIPSISLAGEAISYISLGAYHRDCQLTDRALCENSASGSDTPGTIDFGVRIKAQSWWTLQAEEVDIGWHHQSYVDRGNFFGTDRAGGEMQIDMYGVKWTWEIDSLKMRW